MQPTPSQPASGRAHTLHARIQQDLRERIVAGHYPPQAQMPTESALMRHYGVSRITVRQALGALENEQLILKVPGKGSFVTQPKPFQSLGRLEGFAEAMGAQGHTPHNRLVSLRAVAASTQVAARLQLPRGTSVTEIRRVRYLDHQPVSLDLTWVSLDLGTRLARADLATRDIFLILENDLGLRLGHADLAMDAVAADPATAELLDVATGSPLLRVDRLTHAQDGRPVDYEQLYCRSDNFQYRLRIARQAAHLPHSQPT